jgi:hypothetical protein
MRHYEILLIFFLFKERNTEFIALDLYLLSQLNFGGIGVRFSAAATYYSLVHRFQTGFGAHLAS